MKSDEKCKNLGWYEG